MSFKKIKQIEEHGLEITIWAYNNNYSVCVRSDGSIDEPSDLVQGVSLEKAEKFIEEFIALLSKFN